MTPLSEETRRFILAHRDDDVQRLALQAGRYPAVDMPVAITQISGRKIADRKIPAWAACEEILYPAHLSLEQCSSELTARYKATLIRQLPYPHDTFTDLTGGFGIDCAFLSAAFRHAAYVERQESLCTLAAHNFPLLGLKHITVHHADSVDYLRAMQPVDWIFIDPARRDGHGGKTVAIGDCEPDVAALEELLLAKAAHVLVKLSPMLDLSRALTDLKQVSEAHIVSVDNECKELLLVLSRETVALPAADDLPIHCLNFTASAPAGKQPFIFTRREEKQCTATCTSTLQTYLYEPNASLLKAGAFRSLAAAYGVEKLHPNSHLYTAATLIADFPGRKFRITGSCSFNKKEVKTLLGDVQKANLTVRNFPASVADLRKRFKLPEGGNTYLFATTLADERKCLIRCEAVR